MVSYTGESRRCVLMIYEYARLIHPLALLYNTARHNTWPL